MLIKFYFVFLVLYFFSFSISGQTAVLEFEKVLQALFPEDKEKFVSFEVKIKREENVFLYKVDSFKYDMIMSDGYLYINYDNMIESILEDDIYVIVDHVSQSMIVYMDYQYNDLELLDNWRKYYDAVDKNMIEVKHFIPTLEAEEGVILLIDKLNGNSNIELYYNRDSYLPQKAIFFIDLQSDHQNEFEGTINMVIDYDKYIWKNKRDILTMEHFLKVLQNTNGIDFKPSALFQMYQITLMTSVMD